MSEPFTLSGNDTASGALTSTSTVGVQVCDQGPNNRWTLAEHLLNTERSAQGWESGSNFAGTVAGSVAGTVAPWYALWERWCCHQTPWRTIRWRWRWRCRWPQRGAWNTWADALHDRKRNTHLITQVHLSHTDIYRYTDIQTYRWRCRWRCCTVALLLMLSVSLALSLPLPLPLPMSLPLSLPRYAPWEWWCCRQTP
jgi:hypothetical protein